MGLKNDVDISVYASPEFNGEQMHEIRQGLEAGIDVSMYANADFNPEQMLQIRWGLEDGIDASIYANPKFDYNQMEKIKIGLQTRENGDYESFLDHIDSVVEKTKREQQALLDKQTKSKNYPGEEH